MKTSVNMRKLAEEDLPIVAKQIIEVVKNYKPPSGVCQWLNEPAGINLAGNLIKDTRFVDGRIAFAYFPATTRISYGDEKFNWAHIRFSNIRVTDIESRVYGEVDESPAGKPTVNKRTIVNNTSEPIARKIMTETERTTHSQSSLALEVSASIEQTIKASGTYFAASVESETKVSASSTVATESSKGREDRGLTTEELDLTVPANKKIDVITTKELSFLNQTVTAKGNLEADIEIWTKDGYQILFHSFEEMFNLFRGLGMKTDQAITNWFDKPSNALSEEEIQRRFTIPQVELNVGITGVPAVSLSEEIKEVAITD